MKILSVVFFVVALALFPLLPLLMALAFQRRKYVVEYVATLRRLAGHLRALAREQSLDYYLESVFDPASTQRAEIGGHCVRCGNCCLQRRCVFLDKDEEGKYLCGIYHSPLRKLSNCGSYPINQRDIERYACPSYYVIQTIPVKTVFEPGAEPIR